MQDGSLDAAVIALPFDIPGFETITLYDEPFKVLVSKKHKWNKNLAVNAKQLIHEKILLLDNTHCFSMQVREACPGISNNAEVQTGTSLETIRNMVASNLGISILPQSATTNNYKNREINILSFENPVPFRKVAIAYRHGSTKKDSLIRLKKLVDGIKKQIIDN